MTPEIKKQAVLMLYQQGQPYAEIAESLLMSKIQLNQSAAAAVLNHFL